MQGNFSINLPSIPAGVLKFKIQDVKSKGFMTKENRFKDDKTYLTGRFINSFPNLIPKTSQNIEKSSYNSQISTNISRCFKDDPNNFRWMISDDKKNLLLKYQALYKDYQPCNKSEKIDKGFSFPKSGMKDSLDGQIHKFSSQVMNEPLQSSMDNYYFNNTVESQGEDFDVDFKQKQPINKLNKPSAVFKSQNRWNHNQRSLKRNIIPGPGSYIRIQSKKKKNAKPPILNNQSSQLVRIKQILKDYKPESYQNPQQKQQQIQSKRKNAKNKVFIENQINRFGEPIYPISPKLIIPGPGSYEYNDTLEQKSKKILLVEEQRKLLKEWYYQ